MSYTILYVGSTESDGPSKEKEAYRPSKAVMGEHEGKE